MKRAILVALAVGLAAQLGGARVAARQVDDLKFFKNFFVTGDYYIAGVGLKDVAPDGDGLATGSIDLGDNPQTTEVVEGVPRGADILAAYLYWQVVSDTGPDAGALGVKFKGFDLTLPNDKTTPGVDPKPFGKILASEGTAACFNPGGGTGDNGSSRRTYTYRMDVLRFFDVEEPGELFEGKTKLVGQGVTHSVSLPNLGGNGNQAPIALGASLMIVYRYLDPTPTPANPNPTKPLNAIVIYDDGVTLGNAQRTLTQPIAGFYQPDATNPNASIWYIVGSGDPAKNEAVSLTAPALFTAPALVPDGPSVMNPFSASSGASWDNRTYSVNLGANPSDLQSITTTVTNDIGQRDCLTLAAIVFKTAVKDSDGDGLLDKWETATTPLSDPNNKPLPLLSKMGAKVDHKDVFIEIGYMDIGLQPDGPDPGTDLDLPTYGGEPKPPHSHRPTYETLKLAGDTFKNAPVLNPDDTLGINVHFDVGTSSFPGCPAAGPCEYIIGRQPGDAPALAPPTGGERMDEMATAGDVAGDTIQGCVRAETDLPWVCQYKDFPGTVGWKTGYRFIRDELLNIVPAIVPAPPAPEDYCDKPVNPANPTGARYACTLRFDPNRRNMFRYAFFAHALGIPKSPEIYTSTGGENPDFHTPITNTGIADWLGGDLMLTLGAFLDYDNASPVGTPFQQASTLVHELGHTMGRRHNGDMLAPNCTPQYFSVMNYVYQLRGLVDANGIPRIDLAKLPASDSLNESSLTDGVSGAISDYRMSWYAPIAGPLAAKPGVTEAKAKRHCDGSLIMDGAQYVRVDTGTLGAVDWNVNNITDSIAQDINFDGLLGTLSGTTDWDKLELNQIGSRRSPGGYFFIPGSTEIGVGPLSLGGGKGDLGTGDVSEYALGNGKGDLGGGKGDLGGGKGDLGGGKGDLGGGKGDLGIGSPLGGGKGDLGNGKGDLGNGDGGGGDFFGDEGEVDETIAADLMVVPPTNVSACQNCAGAPLNYVRVSWTAPTSAVLSYTPYRALVLDGQTGPWKEMGSVANGTLSWIDPDSHKLVQGQTYAYQVTATYLVKNLDTPAIPKFVERESIGSSPNAIVMTFTNASPAIVHSIPAQSIRRNQQTAPLPFTATDTESDNQIGSPSRALSISHSIATSTNPLLNGQISVTPVVNATTGARTLIVKHVGNERGTVTIRLIAEDTQCSLDANPPASCTPGKGTSATTFTVEVRP